MAILDFFKRIKEKKRFLRKREFKKEGSVIKDDGNVQKEKKIEDKKLFFGDVHRIINSPHTTEKSSNLKERDIYVFKVQPEANKIMIKNAVQKLYGAPVEKVNIIKISAKKKLVRGKWGKKPGYKKAVVYLKKGEKIEV